MQSRLFQVLKDVVRLNAVANLTGGSEVRLIVVRRINKRHDMIPNNSQGAKSVPNLNNAPKRPFAVQALMPLLSQLPFLPCRRQRFTIQ